MAVQNWDEPIEFYEVSEFTTLTECTACGCVVVDQARHREACKVPEQSGRKEVTSLAGRFGDPPPSAVAEVLADAVSMVLLHRPELDYDGSIVGCAECGLLAAGQHPDDRWRNHVESVIAGILEDGQ